MSTFNPGTAGAPEPQETPQPQETPEPPTNAGAQAPYEAPYEAPQPPYEQTPPAAQQNVPPMNNQVPAPYVPMPQYSTSHGMSPVVDSKSKLATFLLAFFLGGLGIHNFYLGYTTRGIIQLAVSLLSIGFLAPVIWIWAFIEGILYLVANPGTKYSVDARGIPLN